MSCHHADVRGPNNPFWGRKHNEKTLAIFRGKKSYMTDLNIKLKGKVVVSLDPNTMDILKEYQSAGLASMDAGISRVSVARRCNKQSNRVRAGAFWRWKDDYNKEDVKWAQSHQS
jgi:hypothetical protein